MKEATLYKKLKEKTEQFNRVKCQNCSHYCVIAPARRGLCGVRENIDGQLFALNYGKAVAVDIDPIEKKPLFHFLPGTRSLSLATAGCNFRCANCQNWDISQGFKEVKEIPGQEISSEEIVKMALKNNLPSISCTYTEPAIFSEYALEIMKLAKKKGIKNVWVSNGFWSEELFDLISPFLDAANIDIKSFSDDFYKEYCGARLQPVLDTLKRLKKAKIWTEVTTLVIPTLNDQDKIFEDIAHFIKKELGQETPWHITQFSGAISWKLQHLPDTPVETIKRACKIGRKAGLKYVYSGNVPGLPLEDTFCPKCRALCIDRTNYVIHRYDKNGQCPKCNENLNLILTKN